MSRELVTSSRYSPGNMTGEALEKLFVGREKILTDVLKRVVASVSGEEKHYILLVGPRGSGKTHLTSLLAHKLRHDTKYTHIKSRLRIAHLNEEEWGVASFLDFLVRILSALAAEYQDSKLTQSIEEIYKLYAKNPDTALIRAQELVVAFVGDRTLLLICENLLDLFEGLDEEGQKRWRGFIQEKPFWSIIATTPAMFAGVQLQTSPFYGFFTVRYLDRLSFEAANDLLRQKSLLDGRKDLADFLQTPTGRARIRAIHHLAGGNHRVYVIMSDFLSRESLDDLVEPFMRMVDDLTPYYQDRMRQLAPQQRKIVEFLCQTTAPTVVKDIAARCLMSQQTAAKQLSELSRLGIVTRTKSGRETHCELAEPLMRICIEVKDNRTEHLRLFVSFLREWFSLRELRNRLAFLRNTPQSEHNFDRIHISAAVHDCAMDHRQPFLEALTDEGMRCLEQGDYNGLAEASSRLVDEIGRAPDYALCAFALRRANRYSDAVVRATEGLGKYPESASLHFSLADALAATDNNEQALAHADEAVRLAPQEGHYRCLRGAILGRLERYEEVLLNEAALLQVNPRHHHSLLVQACTFARLNQLNEAQKQLKQYLKKQPTHAADAHCEFGMALMNAEYYEKAIEHFDQALAIEPHDSAALCNRGSALLRLGKALEVLSNEDTLLALESNHAHSYLNKGYAFLQLKRFTEAESAARTYRDLRPNDTSGTRLLARALMAQSKGQEALELINQTTNSNPQDTSLRMLKAELLSETGLWEAAYTEAMEALRQTPDSLSIRCFLSECLVELSRYEDAIREASTVLEREGGHTNALVSLLRGYLGIGDFASASHQAVKLQNLGPAEIHTQTLVSAYLKQYGMYDAAYSLLATNAHQGILESSFWLQLAFAEIATFRLSVVQDNLVKAEKLGAPAELLTMARAELETAKGNLHGALAIIKQHFLSAPHESGEQAAETIADALLLISRKQGLAAVASAFNEVVGFLRDIRHEELISTTLTALLTNGSTRRDFVSPGWVDVAGKLGELLDDRDDCSMAVKMLSVATRYAVTKDPTVLLELPIEQRELLSDIIKAPNAHKAPLLPN